ncbi:MAG: response regulator [Spirochaeta sp.]
MTLVDSAVPRPANRRLKRILVIDDIEYVLKSISRTLAAEGFSVFTAKRGSEALMKYMDCMPDVITVDQKLPDMSGLQLIRQLAERHADHSPGIIFISSVYDREEIMGIMKEGIDSYLMKPFKRDKLIETVHEVLQARDKRNDQG